MEPIHDGTPNGKKIAADKAGVAATDRGFIEVDIQMRTNVPRTPRWTSPSAWRRNWRTDTLWDSC